MCIQTTTLRGRDGPELAAGVAMQKVYLGNTSRSRPVNQ
jgi:hypothetical protein